MAGLKAIVLWFPPERVALANGWYIMLGALGALSATGPAETVVQALGWRGLFAVLAVASAAVALLILLVVPERKPAQAAGRLTEDRLPRHLPGPALPAHRAPGGPGRRHVLLAAGPLGRAVAHRRCRARPLRRRRASHPDGGRRSPRAPSCWEPSPSACAAPASRPSCSSPARSPCRWPPSSPCSSACRCPPICCSRSSPPRAPPPSSASPSWRSTSPRRSSGRANAALGVLNMGTAFGLQCLSGFIVALWPADGGRYPAEAHQAAMAAGLGLQLIALGVFFAPKRRLQPAPMAHAVARALGFGDRHRRSFGRSTSHGRTRPRSRAGREPPGVCRRCLRSSVRGSRRHPVDDDQPPGGGAPCHRHIRSRLGWDRVATPPSNQDAGASFSDPHRPRPCPRPLLYAGSSNRILGLASSREAR